MLQLVSKFICFLIMYTTGYLVIKKIVGVESKINKSTYLYILILAIVSIFLHKAQYTAIYTIVIFLFNIIVYKKIFDLKFGQATISTALFMAILILSDIITYTLLKTIWTQGEIRNLIPAYITANILTGIFSVIIVNIKFIHKIVVDFYHNISKKKILTDAIYLILLVIGLTQIAYNHTIIIQSKDVHITNTIIVVIYTFTTIIFLQNKNDYKVLSDEYDSLFNYVQNFEDWIEKEQINRHEYKNQLAVLRTVAKDKKVRRKIDEILDDNINIEDEVVNKLKELPKGGLKGLIYYKVAIAKKNGVDIVVDVSLKRNTKLKNLDENHIKTICKLIGIYFDNAIEAATETKRKYLLLEIYELNDIVNIVISNSFIMAENFNDRNKKGISTKGIGRGNGLYYASNILSKNKWLESKQDIIDEYYIQTLSIKKLDN